MSIEIRVVSTDDAEQLTRLVQDERDFLAPWEPMRHDEYFTIDHQHSDIVQALARRTDGVMLPCVILDAGRIVGRITLNNIIRSVFQTGDLGYWVSRSHNGRGVATAAVAAIVAVAFDEMNLHRLQASTLLHNLASQRVLQRNGFERIGMAPRYLSIDGRWQDHLLHQRINESFTWPVGV